MFKSLLKHMKIESFFQFVLVMIVFAITGSLSLIVTVSLFEVLNLNNDSFSPLVFWPLRIIFIFFVYQVLLLIIAVPFGQFRYFWQFEKKILSRFGFKLN